MKRVLCLPVVGLLAGCAMPPKTIEPDWAASVPSAFAESDNSELTASRPGADWLEGFGDDVLVSLVEESLNSNPDLQTMVAKLDRALAEAKAAGAGIFPQVDAAAKGARAQSVNRAGSGAGGFDDFDNFIVTRSSSLGVSLDIAWELDVWGRVRAGQSAAMADAQATMVDLAAARLSLKGQVAKAWFAAHERALQFALAEETHRSFEQTAETVAGRFDRGLASAADVHLTRSSAAAARASLEEAEMARNRAVRSLEILLGRYPAREIAVTGDLVAVPAPVPPGVPSDLLRRRPDLVAAERRLAASDRRVAQARAAFLPRLALTASGGTSSDALRDLVDPKHFVWNFLVNLAQPIIDGGSRRADLKRNQAIVAGAAAAYRATALIAFREVEDALDAEGLLAERETALREASEQARQAYERGESEYLQGLASIINVLDAQRRYLESQRGYLMVRRLRLDNRVDLHLALGGGWSISSDNDEPVIATTKNEL